MSLSTAFPAQFMLPKPSSDVSSEESLFDTLVKKGEDLASVTLTDQLRNFLVGCLGEHMLDMEFYNSQKDQIVLNFMLTKGYVSPPYLRRAGDTALLLAGLFPEKALRLNVSPEHFRFTGHKAYVDLASRNIACGRWDTAQLYKRVAEGFCLLERVLNATRDRTDTRWEAFLRFKVSTFYAR